MQDGHGRQPVRTQHHAHYLRGGHGRAGAHRRYQHGHQRDAAQVDFAQAAPVGLHLAKGREHHLGHVARQQVHRQANQQRAPAVNAQRCRPEQSPNQQRIERHRDEFDKADGRHPAAVGQQRPIGIPAEKHPERVAHRAVAQHGHQQALAQGGTHQRPYPKTLPGQQQPQPQVADQEGDTFEDSERPEVHGAVQQAHGRAVEAAQQDAQGQRPHHGHHLGLVHDAGGQRRARRQQPRKHPPQQHR